MTTLTRPCACGGTIVAPADMDLWHGPVLRHVRSTVRRRWSMTRTVDPRWRVLALPRMVARSPRRVPAVSVRRVA